MPVFQMRKPRLREVQRLIWSHAAPTVEVQRSGPGTGAVYTEPGPTQGAKSAGKRRRGSSPRDPQVAPHAHPRGCGGRRGSRSAHQAQAGPQPAARSRQASPIDRAPRALDPDAGSGRRRPVRAEPRDGPACPPGLLLRRFEFPGARAARSDPAAAGRGGPQCPKRTECVRSCVLSVREMPHFKDDGKEKKVKHSRQSSLC